MNRWVHKAGSLALLLATAAPGQEAAPTNAAPPAMSQFLSAGAVTNAPPETEDRSVSLFVDHAQELLAQGRLQEAEVIFKNVLAEAPGNRRAKFGLGTLYVQSERYREALDLMEPMAEAFPWDYSVKNNLAWVYATAKDRSIRDGAKAVRLAQEAILLAPEDFHIWSTLSEAYYVLGEYDKALRASEEALAIAVRARAPEENLARYRLLLERNRKAALAMSVID